MYRAISMCVALACGAGATVRVVVFPFDNAFDDGQAAWIGEGLRVGVSAGLSSLPEFLVAERARVDRALAARNVYTPRRITPAIARAAGASLLCDRGVAGSYAVSLGRVAVSLQVYDFRDSVELLPKPASVAAPADSIVAIIVRCAAEAARLMGTPTAGDDERRLSVAVSGTGSAAAFRAFLDGISLRERGLTREALARLESALADDPESPTLWTALGGAYADLMRDGDARAAFEKAISLSPESVEPRLRLGELLLSQAKWKDASRAFEAVLKLRPDDARAREGLARALFGMKKNDEAEREARASVAADSARATASALLGTILGAGSRWDEAAVAFERAASLDPLDVRYREWGRDARVRAAESGRSGDR